MRLGVARGVFLRNVAEEMIALTARRLPKGHARRLAAHVGWNMYIMEERTKKACWLDSYQIQISKDSKTIRETVFQTVANVVEYDQFLPYCTKSKLVEDSLTAERVMETALSSVTCLSHSQIRETIRHQVETVEK